MKTSELLSKLHPVVRLYMEANGVRVMTSSDAAGWDGRSNDFRGLAVYDALRDLIIVKDHLEDYLLNCSILHEIIHSTGHRTRLDRKSIALVEQGIPHYAIPLYGGNIHQEEQTAQWGAHLLMLQHNLFVKESLEYTEGYIKHWDSGNDNYIADAQKAVDYLNNLAIKKHNQKIA